MTHWFICSKPDKCDSWQSSTDTLHFKASQPSHQITASAKLSSKGEISKLPKCSTKYASWRLSNPLQPTTATIPTRSIIWFRKVSNTSIKKTNQTLAATVPTNTTVRISTATNTNVKEGRSVTHNYPEKMIRHLTNLMLVRTQVQKSPKNLYPFKIC